MPDAQVANPVVVASSPQRPNQAKLGQPTLVVVIQETLSANSQKIYQRGLADHLFLYNSTGVFGGLTFSFDDQSAQSLLTGQVVQAQTPFKTVQITNTSGSPITYTIVISYGQIDFKGLVISNGLGVTDVATVIITNPSSTTLAARTTRKKAWVWNNSGSTVYAGDSSVSATQGIPIANGQTIILENTTKIYFTGNVICTEENYS